MPGILTSKKVLLLCCSGMSILHHCNNRLCTLVSLLTCWKKVLSTRVTHAFVCLVVVLVTKQTTWIHRSARTHITIQHFCQQSVEENQRSVYFLQVRIIWVLLLLLLILIYLEVQCTLKRFLYLRVNKNDFQRIS